MREDEYYWVRAKLPGIGGSAWEVKRWHGAFWVKLASSVKLQDEDLTEIGPRTLRPGEATFADPAQLHVAFGAPCPDSSAGVSLSVTDSGTAAEIAAAIGRTPTERQ